MAQSPKEVVTFLFPNIMEVFSSGTDECSVILEINSSLDRPEASGTSLTIKVIAEVRSVARLLLQIGFAPTWWWDGCSHDVGEIFIGATQARACPILIIGP